LGSCNISPYYPVVESLSHVTDSTYKIYPSEGSFPSLDFTWKCSRGDSPFNFSTWTYKVFINDSVVSGNSPGTGLIEVSWVPTAYNSYNISCEITDENSNKSYSGVILYDVKEPELNNTAIVPKTNSELTIYPNPAQNEIFVEIPDLSSGAEILIRNLSGIIVYSGRVSEKIMRIDIDKLSNGLYILEVKCKQGNYSGKLLVF
jgi:hypothetical protein